MIKTTLKMKRFVPRGVIDNKKLFTFENFEEALAIRFHNATTNRIKQCGKEMIRLSREVSLLLR